MGHSRPCFLLFCLFFLIVRSVDKILSRLGFERGTLVSEATALPTEPQPLPLNCTIFVHKIQVKYYIDQELDRAF